MRRRKKIIETRRGGEREREMRREEISVKERGGEEMDKEEWKGNKRKRGNDLLGHAVVFVMEKWMEV